MRITTRAVFQMTERIGEYIPLELVSVEYVGPIEQARGEQMAAAQMGITNAQAAQQGAQAEELESAVIPGYMSLMNTGYVTPEEKAAATTSEMGAATAPFQSAEFQAGNRAAATRNPADLTAQQDVLAQEEGQTAGNAAAELQNQQMRNQLAGMYGLTNLSEENLRAMGQMYGLSAEELGSYEQATNAYNPMSLLNAAIGGAGQAFQGAGTKAV